MLNTSDFRSRDEAGATAHVQQAERSSHCKQSPKRTGSMRGHNQAIKTNLVPTQRMSRALTLKTAAKEYVWLYDHRHGMSVSEIAARDRVSVQRVVFGVGRARAQEKSSTRNSLNEAFGPQLLGPQLVPLFPVGQYTPSSACPHKAPIERGSTLCCMVCHQSGIDQHPALQRDLNTEPVRESKSAAGSPEIQKPARQETRRERRQRTFASVAE